MKKVMMSVALISAIAIAAGYSMIGSDKSEMNVADLTSANVEALADDINSVVGCLPVQEYVCSTPRNDYSDKAPIIYPEV